MTDSIQQMIQQADTCVKCGLCLPHCPTYVDSANEAESPRGRIAIIQGLATGSLSSTPDTLTPLDHCLACRSCETVCPANVPYHDLLVASRTTFGTAESPSTFHRWVRRRPLRWLLKAAIKTLSIPVLGSIVRELPLPKVMKKGIRSIPTHPVLPKVSPQPLPQPPLVDSGGEKITLLQGCVNSIADPTTVRASITLLSALGITVELLPETHCCGAMQQHSGDQKGLRCSQDAIRQDTNSPTILGVATGCTASLQAMASTTLAVDDVCHFVLQHPRFATLHFEALASTVVIHEPCTQRNALQQKGISARLLGAIPALTTVPFDDNNLCCGAAGSQFLEQIDRAQQRLVQKMQQFRTLAGTAPTPLSYIVSANIGCAMHLQSTWREQGFTTEVIHPITLLAMQLRTMTND